MKLLSTFGLLGVFAIAPVSLFAQSVRPGINPPPSGEAPQIVRARGDLASPQERAPSEAFGFFGRTGPEGAAENLGKAFKKKIEKSQITGPIELTVDHLAAGPDRFLEFVGVDNLVPGAAKIGSSSQSMKFVRLHFKPFKANVPHLLLWHMQNFHVGNPQTYVIQGSGIKVKHDAKGGANQPIGVVVVPADTTPLTITVSASSGYWWRFYGVEVSMLNE